MADFDATMARLKALKDKTGADYVEEGGVGYGDTRYPSSRGPQPAAPAKKKKAVVAKPTTRLRDMSIASES